MIFKKYKREYKDILRLAFPVILSQAGQIMVQLVDNAMVGRLGAVPLASVSFGGAMFFMVFVLGMGMTFGLTPLIGEMYSQSNHRKSASYLQNSLLLYGGMSILLFAIAMSLVPFMARFNPDPEVVAMAVPYFKYLAWSLFPFMIFAAFKQFLEGIGNTKVAMVIIITSNLINVFFNWLLIYGNWGFSAMGAPGAGLATMISRFATPILIITYFWRRDSLGRYFKFFKIKGFSWERIRSLLKVGSPIAVQMFMEGAAFALTGIMMGWIGTLEMASNQIASTISNFAFMILIGVSSSLTICVSHAYGRRNWNEVRRYASAGYRLGLMWNGITALLFLLLRQFIPMIFSSDPAVQELASKFLLFVAIFQISDGLQANSVGILRGIQDVKNIMWVAFVSYIVVSLPLSYLLAFKTQIGAVGIWLGLIIGLAVAAILLNARYKKQLDLHLKQAES